MRIGVNLQPTGDWSGMLATAQAAEASGFDAIGDKLVTWEKLGVERTFLTFWQPNEQLALASTFIS